MARAKKGWTCKRCSRPVGFGAQVRGYCPECYLLVKDSLPKVQKKPKPDPKIRIPWAALDEIALLREFGRTDFWTHFLYVFGAGANPKGKRWIEPAVHEPLARWFQHHVIEWHEARVRGEGIQKHLAVLVHR